MGEEARVESSFSFLQRGAPNPDSLDFPKAVGRDTSPEGVEVEIDGAFTGNTPQVEADRHGKPVFPWGSYGRNALHHLTLFPGPPFEEGKFATRCDFHRPRVGGKRERALGLS